MKKNYSKQRGFALVAIMIAILVIGVVAFGTIKWKGQIEQSKQIENKAVIDLQKINDNLKKNNQEIQNELGVNKPDGLIKNETSNYKKYSNDKIGYEISFPPNWTFDPASADYFQIYSDYGGIDIQPDDNRMKIVGVIYTNTEKNIDSMEEVKLGNKIFKKISVENSNHYYYSKYNRIIEFSYLPNNLKNTHIDEFYKIIESFDFLPVK